MKLLAALGRVVASRIYEAAGPFRFCMISRTS